MPDKRLPNPPDMIVFLPRHTLTFTGNHAHVDCAILGATIWDAPIPSGMTPEEFLELFEEEV